MALRWAIAVLATACGRIGFDPTAAATSDAGGDGRGDGDAGPQMSLADRLPCNTPVVLAPGSLSIDFTAWLADSAGEWVLTSEHVALGVHPIRRYAIEDDGAGGIRARDTGIALQTADVYVMSFAPVTGGLLVGYDDGDGNGWTVPISPGVMAGSMRSLGAFDYASSAPLVRMPGGPIAFVGTGANELDVLELDESGAVVGGPFTIAPATDLALDNGAVATDDGFALVWRAQATNDCYIVTLDANLAVRAGPVVFDLPKCIDPRITWIPAKRRLVVVATDDPGDNYYGVYTADLVPEVAPTLLGFGIKPLVVGDVDGAWITWHSNTLDRMASARLAADLTLAIKTPIGDLGDYYSHQMNVVAGRVIATWMDNANDLNAARLCP